MNLLEHLLTLYVCVRAFSFVKDDAQALYNPAKQNNVYIP